VSQQVSENIFCGLTNDLTRVAKIDCFMIRKSGKDVSPRQRCRRFPRPWSTRRWGTRRPEPSAVGRSKFRCL